MSRINALGRTATAVCTVDKVTHVTYHNTAVVSFDADKVTLRTGGWRTATTKMRMNQAANQYGLGFTVSQKDYDWTVNCSDGRKLRFDGNELTFDR